ncbi:hypothetical protein ISF_07971 [Cordyceps fumosorosea ARSEF 2679]|uniref:Uncharacterized protein n=1 Tax=Cordyceps fumosorosea (strain ARSEF 2679) TaxID=1081104 RepID=A0A162MFI7_CORFA|nr:hypothetical protein ISF_07971 [Cordyceps fumosorosea ARSEF 2679]OAA55460.1 hypothetical protein ISF_07971 [Cordyceps fumosorosea ARSEF 2679]
MPSRTSLLALAAAAALTPLAAAVDLNDPLDGCPSAVRSLAAGQPIFNSTGEARLPVTTASDPWYLALGFRDEREKNAIYGLELTRQSLDVIVSVPETFPGSAAGRQTSLCVYRLRQQNATADEQASCDGVLSDACVKALESVQAPAAGDGSCPVPDVSAACGDGAEIVASTATPLLFNGTLCSTNATIPDSEAIPDGYRSYVTFASGQLRDSDDSRASFAAYAEHIQRPAPILVTARLGGNSTTGGGGGAQSKLLCLAPSKVTKGSRGAVVNASSGATAAALLGAAKPVLLVSLLSSVLAVAL